MLLSELFKPLYWITCFLLCRSRDLLMTLCTPEMVTTSCMNTFPLSQFRLIMIIAWFQFIAEHIQTWTMYSEAHHKMKGVVFWFSKGRWKRGSHNKMTVCVEELSVLKNKHEIFSGLNNKQAFSWLTLKVSSGWPWSFYRTTRKKLIYQSWWNYVTWQI